MHYEKVFGNLKKQTPKITNCENSVSRICEDLT